MLPHAIPGLSNLWLIATKDTALLAVVGFTELTLATRQAAGTTKAYLLFSCAAGVLYLVADAGFEPHHRIIERRSRRGMAGSGLMADPSRAATDTRRLRTTQGPQRCLSRTASY